jgi:hypothetical protein
MGLYLEINVWSLQVHPQGPQKMKWERYLPLKLAVPVLLGKTNIMHHLQDSIRLYNFLHSLTLYMCFMSVV